MTHEGSSPTRSTAPLDKLECMLRRSFAGEESGCRSAWVVVRYRASGMYTATASTHHSPEYLPGDPPSTIVGEECDRADGNSRPLMSVTEPGVWLPHGKTDRIFNAFFTTKPQGAGLGLAIARSVV